MKQQQQQQQQQQKKKKKWGNLRSGVAVAVATSTSSIKLVSHQPTRHTPSPTIRQQQQPSIIIREQKDNNVSEAYSSRERYHQSTTPIAASAISSCVFPKIPVVLLRQRQLVNVIEVIKVIKVINVVNVVKELVDIVNTIECCRRRRAPEMTVTRRGTAQPRFSNNHQHHRYKTFLLTPIIGLLLQTQNVTGGICWSSINNGKCKELLSQGVTRAECCASNAAAATAYSDEDLDSGSLFFWRVLGGGVHCRPCRESCAEVRCDEGKKCVVRRGRPRCVCSPECKISRGNSSAGPVCGTDGRSYRSLCRLKKHACKKATHQLSIAYNGYCQSSCSRVHCGNGRSCLLDQNLSPHCVKCARKCPPSSSHHVTSGRPVCGADGNTYKSACHLRLAACRAGRAIPIAYKGHCK
ncbi:hypothetical protein PV326_003341, partial [Microctonus aethiopoides]